MGIEEKRILNTDRLPFCRGCGHHLIARNTAVALEKIGVDPLDVVLVTDIGCHGIVDKCFNTHTVHGLHGRSVALGAGIAMGLSDPRKKVVVFIGDGGATLGLQHLLEAARLNVDLKVVLHNNMLYGMTGGQASGLTPPGFKTRTTPNGNTLQGYNLCELLNSAGAAYTRRIIARGDFSDELAEAFRVEGFSFVEVVEVCTSYGKRFNPGTKLDNIFTASGGETKVWRRTEKKVFSLSRKKSFSLLDELPEVETRFSSPLRHKASIILGGSAGEGVQRAASLLAHAAVASGLYVTHKGSFPVTVGVGFSNAELLFSPTPIYFHGVVEPDFMVITSGEGLAYNEERIKSMSTGVILIDETLKPPETGAKVVTHNFRGLGARNAAIYATLFFSHYTGIVPVSAVLEALRQAGLADKTPVGEMMKRLGLRDARF